jgi:HEAT repeat protein
MIPGGAGLAHGQPARTPKKPAKKTATDIALWVEDLRGAELKAAIRAAEELGASQDPQALEALLDALALGLHPEVAATALDGLVNHGDAAAYDTLAVYLRYREPRVRAAAVRAMGGLNDRRSPGHVLMALSDTSTAVRAAAIAMVAARNLRMGIESMLELVKKGDDATAPALAAMGDADVARALGELIGVAPDRILARALGGMILRPEFGPETARVQVVRTLSKIPGPEAVAELRAYVQAIPEKPPRQSRREAAAFVAARSGKPGASEPAAPSGQQARPPAGAAAKPGPDQTGQTP